MRTTGPMSHRARTLSRTAVALLAALTVLPAPPAAAAPDLAIVRVIPQQVVTGLAKPVALADAGGGTLLVAEQGGTVRAVTGGRIAAQPFLDLRGRISTDGERGLLGIALHPGYADNRLLFVCYTTPAGEVRISRFTADAAGATVLPSTERPLSAIPHADYANHNGGQLAFGPDGYLYVGLGDGGGAGDPDGNAQNLGSFLGKILRIDVFTTPTGGYRNPPGNPYRGVAGARPQVWASGLRNPWRFSFDRATGDLWVGDVGQGAREEVDRIPAGAGGRNLGWDCREGTLDVVATYGGDYCGTVAGAFQAPEWEYQTRGPEGRCAVIGGYVYRGSQYSATLGGLYLAGDYCTGEILALRAGPGESRTGVKVGRIDGLITAFGEGPGGEVYVLSQGGSLYRLAAARLG